MGRLSPLGWSPQPGTAPRAFRADILGCPTPALRRGRLFFTSAAPLDAASMQEIKEQPTTASEATDGLMADALRAEAWAGEPFIREGEDPAKVLAPRTSRRRALDDALAEIEGGRRTPSSGWKVEYGLMLGLERVLAEEKPHLASGTELRRHQIDALAGMLTELIASHEKEADPNGNGNGVTEVVEAEAEAEDEDEPAEGSVGA